MDKPDFFLASSEGYGMEEPRRCQRIKHLRSDHRSDLLLIAISPALIGQRFGLGDRDIDTLIIATRHKGDSLFPIAEWPVFVHVARPVIDDIRERDDIRDNEFESIGWAELYPSEEEAKRKLT